MEWMPISTAPKVGEFLATDGRLLGVGEFYPNVQPAEIYDVAALTAGHPPFKVPNPKAGESSPVYLAGAFHAFDGEAETSDYDGPVTFTPTHWIPLPAPPVRSEIP